MLLSWWRGKAQTRPAPARKKPATHRGNRFRPVLEGLEHRLAPAAHTWTGGGGSGLWSEDANWTGGAPAFGEANVTLTFPGGAARLTEGFNDVEGLVVQTITFTTTGGYVIAGNPIALTGGLTSTLAAAGQRNTLALDIIADPGQTINNVTANTFLDLLGSITTTSNVLFDGAGITTLSNPGTGLSGSGLATRLGAGTLVVDTDVTISTLRLQAGVLQLNRDLTNADTTLTLAGGTLQSGTNPVSVDAQLELVGGTTTVIGGGNQFTFAGNNNRLTGPPNSTATLTVTNPQQVVISGDLGEPFPSGIGLAKAGIGRLVLAGNNSYTGATAVNAGTLVMQHINALGPGSAAVTVAAGGTLQLDNVSGTLTKPLTLNGGGAAGTGGAVHSLGGTVIWTTPLFTLAGNTSVGVDAGQLTLDGVVAGAFALTKNGLGTLVLPGANTYTGATTINAGVLTVQNSTGLGTVAGGVTVAAGATLQLQGGLAVGAEALTLNGNGAPGTAGALEVLDGTNSWAGTVALASATTISVDAGQLTLSGIVSGAGALTKGGAGTLVLTAANTYTGATTIAAGTVNIQTNTGLGTNAAGTAVADGATLQLQGNLNVAGEALTLGSGQGGGAVLQNVSGTSTWTGGVALNSAGTLSVDAGQLTITGVISGANDLTKLGAGTLVMTGINTYTGATTIGAGIVTVQGATGGLGGGNGTPGTGTTVESGATLILQGAGTGNVVLGNEALVLNGPGAPGTTGPLQSVGGNNSSTGPVALNTDVTIAVTAGTLTLSGVVSGDADLTKVGNGMLVLSGANTYTGDTRVTAGILNVQNTTGLGTTDGGTTVSNGATLQLQGNLNVGNEALVVSGAGATGTAGVLQSISGTSTWAGSVTLAANSTLSVDAGTLTLNGVVSGASALTKAGAGTLVLAAANTYTGATTINTGIVNVRSDTGLGTAAGGTTVNANATLQLQGNLTVTGEALTLNGTGAGGTTGALQSVSGTTTWTGTVALATNTTVSVDAGTLTLGGVVSGGGNLTKAGAGTLVLAGNNTYGGTTTINTGAVTVQSATGLGANPGGAVTVAGAATLQLQGGITVPGKALTLNTTGGLVNVSDDNTWTGPITLGAAANTVTVTADQLTLSGVVSGVAANALTKAGAGNLVLSGANAYLGVTNVNAGVLTAQNNSALGGNAAAQNTVVNTGATLRVQGGVTVAEPLTLNGTGAAGTTGTLENGSGNNTWSGAVTLGSNSTVGAAAGQLTITGVISGAPNLTKGGAGTVVLNAVNTYTGLTTVAAGFLGILNNAALGASGAGQGTTVNDGATLLIQGGLTVLEPLTLNGIGTGGVGAVQSISGTNTWNGPITLNTTSGIIVAAGQLTIGAAATGIVSGAGGLLKAGAGILQLGAANTYAGVTDVQGGTVLVTNAAGLGSATGVAATGTLVRAGATLQVQGGIAVGNELLTLDSTVATPPGPASTLLSSGGNNSWGGPVALVSTNNVVNVTANQLTVSGIVQGAGTLTKAGGATLILTAANTFTGAATVAAGILNITNASALGTAAGGTTVSGGATLQLQGTIAGSVAEPLTLNGTGATGTSGALQQVLAGTGAVSNTVTGAITLASATTIGVDASATQNGTLTLSGVISGAGALTKAGTIAAPGVSTLVLSGANTYTGATTVSNGILNVRSNTALGAGDGTAATGTTVAAGAALQLQGNLAVGNELVVLNGAGTAPATGALQNVSGTSTWAGPVQLVSASTVSTDAGALTVNGVVSGAGPLTKAGAGTLALAAANTYTGTTTINAGVVAVLNGAGLGASPGGAVAVTGGASLQLLGNITVAKALTLNTTGALASVAGNNTWAGGITLNGALATIAADNGALTVSGVISGPFSTTLAKAGASTVTFSGNNTYTGFTAVISGTLNVLSATGLGTSTFGTAVNTTATLQLQGNLTVVGEQLALLTGVTSSAVLRSVSGTSTWTGGIDLGPLAAFPSVIAVDAGQLTVSGALAGDNTFVKAGAGTLVLAGDNTYTGATGVNDGTLRLGAAERLPDAGLVAVLPGATLDLNNFSETIDALSGGGSIVLGSGTLTVGANDGTSTFGGVLSGTGGLTKVGAGLFTLAGSNTYTGPTTISGGPLELGRSEALADTGNVFIGPAGTLSLAGFNETVGSLSGGGAVALGTGTLGVGANNLSTLYAGTISGPGGLFKLGTGLLTLTGNNTYTGPTTVASGILGVNGVQPASPVTVNAGTALIGSGTVGPLAVQGGGLVNPGGTGTGVLTVNGNATFAPGATLTVDINGSTVGTGYDQLFVLGPTVTLAGSTLFPQLRTAPGLNVGLTIVRNTQNQPVVGTFAGLPERADFLVGGLNFRISYRDGVGQDVVITSSFTANQRYVAQLFLDLLGRPVDAGGLAFWTGQLDAGLGRDRVVAALQSTPEYRQQQVQVIYQSLLGRRADPGGLNGWANALQAGTTVEQIKIAIMSSQEYYDRNGGTNNGFLAAVWRDALGRPIDPAALDFYSNFLINPGGSRQVIAQAVVTSAEAFTLLVRGFYTQYLRRPGDPGGVNFFVGFLQAGGRDEAIIANLVSSAEYFNRL